VLPVSWLAKREDDPHSLTRKPSGDPGNLIEVWLLGQERLASSLLGYQNCDGAMRRRWR
jgi:hypothetical protein